MPDRDPTASNAFFFPELITPPPPPLHLYISPRVKRYEAF
jgi:hypothetical protein